MTRSLRRPGNRRWFLVVALFAYAYLRAPVDVIHDRSGCSDCGEYFGRWWEPGLVMFLGAAGFLAWVVGMAAGAVGSLVLRNPRHSHQS